MQVTQIKMELNSCMVLKYQHILRRQPRSTWSSIEKEAMDINADPGCSKVIDPETVPASSWTLDMTMDPVSVEAS